MGELRDSGVVMARWRRDKGHVHLDVEACYRRAKGVLVVC